jgi:hypothetical protein
MERVNLALADPQAARRDSTIVSVLVLALYEFGPGQQVGLASGASEPTEAESQNGTLEHVIAAVVLRHTSSQPEVIARPFSLPLVVIGLDFFLSHYVVRQCASWTGSTGRPG